MGQAEVEEQLDALERVHALVRSSADEELPDRTLTLRYRFVHVLYQAALDAALRPTRRVVAQSSRCRRVARVLRRSAGQGGTGVGQPVRGVT